jgi:hypothetical protein
LPEEQHTFYSDAALGKLELERLCSDKFIIDVAPIGDEEEFWPEEIQIQAADAINEKVVLMLSLLCFSTAPYKTVVWFFSIARDIHGCLSIHRCPRIQISARMDLRLTAICFFATQYQMMECYVVVNFYLEKQCLNCMTVSFYLNARSPWMMLLFVKLYNICRIFAPRNQQALFYLIVARFG